LAATYVERLAAIVMVDPSSFVRAPTDRRNVEELVSAMEAGDLNCRGEFIEKHRFLRTSDRKLMERVISAMAAVPSYVAASAMRGILAFDAPAVAARCTVPVLHLAATPPLNPPHLMSTWLPTVVNGWTVGAGHFNQLEVPDQVNSMIEGFLRHYVRVTGS
jgi:pimeloyl-ACP methyl ester carboxylesterase